MRALNTLPNSLLADERHRTAPWVVVVSGDDEGAKRVVYGLISTLFEPFDLGDTGNGWLLEPRSLFWNNPLTLAEAQALFDRAKAGDQTVNG